MQPWMVIGGAVQFPSLLPIMTLKISNGSLFQTSFLFYLSCPWDDAQTQILGLVMHTLGNRD
jgi:hypothetical protein